VELRAHGRARAHSIPTKKVFNWSLTFLKMSNPWHMMFLRKMEITLTTNALLQLC
jgi:hypothetical protein